MTLAPAPLPIAKGKKEIAPAPRNGQPARPDRRRHGHRQDGHAARAGGAVQRDRRSGLPGGREGGPVRDPAAGRRQSESRRTGSSTQTGRVRIPGVSRHLLGPLRGAGAPRARHHLGDGPAPPRADPQPERHPVRRAEPRLQDRGRQRHAAAGPQGPAGDGAVRRGQRRPVPDLVRQHRRRERRGDPAGASRAGGTGRGPILRRARARPAGPPSGRSGRPRDDQHPRRIPAHDLPQSLLHVPAVPSLRAVRAAPRGGGSAEALPRLLLRRGPPALHGRAEAVPRKDRAGGAARPLERRGGVFRHPESHGHPRPGPRPVGEQGAARLAGVFPQRAEGGQGRRRDVPGEPEARCRQGDHRARGRGGARLRPGREGDAVRGGARLRPAAPEPAHPPLPGGAGAGRPRFGAPRTLRERGGSGVRLREAEGEGGAAAGGGKRGRDGSGRGPEGRVVPPRRGPRPGC